jgi:P-type conjugative transfer protein TrbL
MSLRFVPKARIACVAAMGLAWATGAHAQVHMQGNLVTLFLDRIDSYAINHSLFDSASTLFWSLAVISLVWTMSVHVVRQDFGEMFMELVRFMVVTGTFYWFLMNAGSQPGQRDGFVHRIIDTFLVLPTGSSAEASLRSNADGLLGSGMSVFLHTLNQVAGGSPHDQIIGLALASVILALLACIAAQFLVALAMAWILAYAGIFLLGFGGGRWTAPIAISYYKHVVALGAAMLTLTIIGFTGTSIVFDLMPKDTPRAIGTYIGLSQTLAVCILMLVLSTRVPQIMYALVTGSPVGMYAGTAIAAGHAFASGGAAIGGTFQRSSSGGAGGAPGGVGAEAVMSAAGRAGMDAFHVGTGADPFGVPRRADPYRHGTAFGTATTMATPVVDMDMGRAVHVASGVGKRST